MDRFVVISGCSGGGKSALLEELRHRGNAVIEEPGRRIVEEEERRGGRALPWVNPAAFARRCAEVALQDHVRATSMKGWVFFDRGLVDAAVELHRLCGTPMARTMGGRRYNPQVFMAPPWSEIFVQDDQRRHGLPSAIAEYIRLARIYPALGYRMTVLPKASVSDRAELVLALLALQPSPFRPGRHSRANW